MKNPWGIHWFRRDLRILGNIALQKNAKKTNGCTLGLFCFDSKFLSRSDFSHNRFAFFLQTLLSLKNELKDHGGDLLVIDCLPQEAFPLLLNHCKRHKISPPSLVTWGRDYEPYARSRDAAIEKILSNLKVPFLHLRDHLLFEPHEVLKNDKSGDFYKVYSPFNRKWHELLLRPIGKERIYSPIRTSDFFKKNNFIFKIKWSNLNIKEQPPFVDKLETFIKHNSEKTTITIPDAGFLAAYKQLKIFQSKILDYNKKRDFPAILGTSRISIFLKNGSLTVPQIISFLHLNHPHLGTQNGGNVFLNELIWREFYYSILYHHPQVENKSFLPQYENLQWENNRSFFSRWKEGTTGFPIVDAGMRQLVQTGWMHNRVRMIVASFLVKDLLIDWKWGEKYFMHQLLDGDLASNNGGWQWVASTGCDPQPYFRIFNPWLQSLKFDAEGTYIKTYVPELRDVPAQALHQAHANRNPSKYPTPMVNHSIQKEKAIRLYKHPSL